MGVDEFWLLIEQSARETTGKEARLEWLHERLVQRSAEEIVDFDAWILTARRKVDTWLMWGAVRALYLDGSDDGFWYFQMWLVGQGRETFERVAREPDALVDVPAVQRLVVMARNRQTWTNDDWPTFESLAYVAVKAWDQATGKGHEELADALESRGFELFALPNPTDEAWELDNAEESARRLPRINRYMRELYG
ncbi:DUF4240 domain-containing protein [Nonomuraea turkmeniaca]|uniref:DUF4240 domain-containing protein n=1 Tax=Nonomuraea turkmeniaca TaxID=103838 RepID=A0A5S4GF53_9ACTN|nr:DUF4240 domain-containing protein [Nonomuraea turkmeniaca]TMR24760.1 DUF4240 domain-containing protein [Nonomuraea turkmeniaca]